MTYQFEPQPLPRPKGNEIPIMEALAAHPEGLESKIIARMTGIRRGTVRAILQKLIRRDLVAYGPTMLFVKTIPIAEIRRDG